MDFIGVPVIAIVSYMFGEVYKVVFKNNEDVFNLIPILVGLLGGILGVLIYLTVPEMIFNVDNIWSALIIGIFSGISSTGTNQIIKKLEKREEEK